MVSKPGGELQDQHQEYVTEDSKHIAAIAPGLMPASAIVVLEPGTTLPVFTGYFMEINFE